jgi:hypothetical protein
MRDRWQLLRDGGVPLAIAGAGARPEPPELARCARDVIAQEPGGRDAEALAAWIHAWRDHWPQSFEAGFEADAGAVVAWAERAAVDPGRHVKLRRIAIENLASLL